MDKPLDQNATPPNFEPQGLKDTIIAPPTDLRSVISQTPGAGLIQGYDTQNNYNPVYVPKGTYVPGISATPKQITTDSFNSENPLKLPQPDTGSHADANAMIAGAGSTVDSITKQLTPTQTPAETQQQDFLNQYASLTGELGNKGTDQLAGEQAAGIPGLKTSYSNLNSQILTKIAESNALDATYQAANTRAEGQPITNFSIQGEQAQNYRMYLAQKNSKAAEIGLLQAQSQGLQGQITTAQDTVNRAIDLKYSTKEAQLATLKAQMDAIMPTLNKEEKTHALAQQVLIDKQKQDLADSKQKEKDVQDTMLAYIKAGGKDQNVISELSNAKTTQQALEILATNKPPDTQVIDLGNRKVLINSTTGQAIKDLGRVGKAGGIGVSGTGIISPQTQAIIDNPSLFDNLTATAQGNIISELQKNDYDTSNLGTKPLTDTAIQKIADLQTGLAGLQDLKTTIAGKSDQLGPIKGLAQYNPYSKAKQLQAKVDLIRQKVGKALEGGVLRKEDEVKYKQILATLTDTPATAEFKIDSLISNLQRDVDTYTALQKSGGRSTDVNAPLTKKGNATKQEDLRKKYNY